MGQGNRATTLQQRVEIWEQAQQGKSDGEIAATLQLSPVTVRKWRRRAQKQGRSGLSTALGRPRRGPLSQATDEVRRMVREKRAQCPGWGPATLRLELAAEPGLAGQAVPSRSALAAFLKAEQLTRRYERHTELTQPVAAVAAPHDEWEMDAQGVRQVTGVGCVSVINIGDPYSHVRVGSQACLGKRKASTADYQLALRRAFVRYGLPKQLSLDHDSAFYDNLSASPYPSRLHLWALALGIAIRFIREGRPTDHGFIERTHQVLDQQALQQQRFADPPALQRQLDQRLQFLNERYPTRTLGGHPPLSACPQALHSGRSYAPEQEVALLDLQRVYLYLAANRWFRHVTPAGQFTLGAYRYGLGKVWANQQIEIHFDPATVVFVCTSENGQQTQRLAAKGLTIRQLMGELQMEQFTNYQYAFPWSASACRQNLLQSEMTGTTL